MSLANESEMANVEFRELARILATGILRFRTHAAQKQGKIFGIRRESP
jgi:hypothetical protein